MPAHGSAAQQEQQCKAGRSACASNGSGACSGFMQSQVRCCCAALCSFLSGVGASVMPSGLDKWHLCYRQSDRQRMSLTCRHALLEGCCPCGGRGVAWGAGHALQRCGDIAAPAIEPLSTGQAADASIPQQAHCGSRVHNIHLRTVMSTAQHCPAVCFVRAVIRWNAAACAKGNVSSIQPAVQKRSCPLHHWRPWTSIA